MTKRLRHTKREIEYAARQAADLGIGVRLEPDGAITFLPDTPAFHSPQAVDTARRGEPTALERWKAKRNESEARGRA